MPGTPITSGGDGIAAATAGDGTQNGSDQEQDVTAYGEVDGTPITSGGDGSSFATDEDGTPITTGGDGG